MESPEGNRIAATSSPSSSSPAAQESPFYNFLSTLSPIESDKAASYTQRLSETNLPTPPPVFTSPHIDLQRETSILERVDVVAAGSNVHGQCVTQLNVEQIASFEKDVQSSSPSGCIDEYLADPVEVECVNSADLLLQSANKVPQLLQSVFTGPIETVKRVDDAVDSKTDNGALSSSDQAEENLPSSSVKFVETAVHLRNDEKFDEILKFRTEKVNYPFDSDTNVDLVSGVQQCEQYAAQNAGAQNDEWRGTCQSFLEPLQIGEACEDSDGSSRTLSKVFVKEANQHQRSIRRHLQFEPAISCESVTTDNGDNSCNMTHDIANSRLRASLTNWKSPIPSHVERRSISSSREAVSCVQPITPQSSFCSLRLRSTQNSVNSAIPSSIPSGIGLHLNSIGRSVSLDSDMFASKNIAGYLSSEDKLMPERNNNLAEDPNSSSISAAAGAGKIYSHVDTDQQESQAGLAASSSISCPNNSLKPQYDSPCWPLIEQQVAPCDGRMSTAQNADGVEELNEMSPKRKRKKTPNSSESEGCKRCNCKRSRCLKLYCDCFAAGVYCVDSCACESCSNKPENEGIVLDTRQQIESRNPLAFAPRIVKHASNSPANVMEEGNWNTPSSARHKRGCNCKKSKCLKKYCECYQAKVGCSDGCRCECCQNSFGTKTAYTRAERGDNLSHEKLDTVERGKDGSFQQISTWEGFDDICNVLPRSGAVTSSSSSIKDCAKVSQAQLQWRSSFLSSAGSLQLHCSPVTLTPQLCGSGSKATDELTSDSALYGITEDDDIPEILKVTSTPITVVKSSSPNKKLVLPPHFRSERQRSSSPRGLRSGRKFILQAVPSFPPLTPYSNSKAGVNQIKNDQKDRSSNH